MKTKKISPLRFVQFSPDLIVHEVPRRQDMTNEERAQIWITRMEYNIIKYNIKRTVLAMETAKEEYVSRDPIPSSSGEDKECTRGLECKTEQGAINKKMASLDGICAVLLEQQRQRNEGKDDPESIRGVYLAETETYMQTAFKQGLRDAEYDKEEEEELQVQEKVVVAAATPPATRTTRGRSRIFRLLPFKRGGSPRNAC